MAVATDKLLTEVQPPYLLPDPPAAVASELLLEAAGLAAPPLPAVALLAE